MKRINFTSKKAAELINAYNRSNNFSVTQCYIRPSVNKTLAEYECLDKMIKEGGHGYRILSFNTFYFTCGWMVGTELRIETPCNSYIIDTNLPF